MLVFYAIFLDEISNIKEVQLNLKFSCKDKTFKVKIKLFLNS